MAFLMVWLSASQKSVLSSGTRAVWGGIRGLLLLCCPLLPSSTRIFSKMLDETTKEEILLCKVQSRPPFSLAETWKLVEEMVRGRLNGGNDPRGLARECIRWQPAKGSRQCAKGSRRRRNGGVCTHIVHSQFNGALREETMGSTAHGKSWGVLSKASGGGEPEDHKLPFRPTFLSGLQTAFSSLRLSYVIRHPCPA